MLVFLISLKLSQSFHKPRVNARNVDNFLTLVRKYTDIKELKPRLSVNSLKNLCLRQSALMAGGYSVSNRMELHWRV